MLRSWLGARHRRTRAALASFNVRFLVEGQSPYHGLAAFRSWLASPSWQEYACCITNLRHASRPNLAVSTDARRQHFARPSQVASLPDSLGRLEEPVRDALGWLLAVTGRIRAETAWVDSQGDSHADHCIQQFTDGLAQTREAAGTSFVSGVADVMGWNMPMVSGSSPAISTASGDSASF